MASIGCMHILSPCVNVRVSRLLSTMRPMLKQLRRLQARSKSKEAMHLLLERTCAMQTT